MLDWLSGGYEWFKTLHVISVIAWMAGLFYLPRLYVYHAEKAPPGSELSETFKVMERRLLRAIMNPAMISSWVFGLLIIGSLGIDYVLDNAWLQVKLLLVVLMTEFHMQCSRWRKKFEADENDRPGRYFRWWNEAPTVLMIGIVVMAVAEPF